jgi:hypothetical protein
MSAVPRVEQVRASRKSGNPRHDLSQSPYFIAVRGSASFGKRGRAAPFGDIGMRRFRKAKRFGVLLVAMLLGSSLAPLSTSMSFLPASATAIASADHTHDSSGCLPAQHASCAPDCAAMTPCGFMPVLPSARIVEGNVSPRTTAPIEGLLHFPHSFASLTEPPPPRA